MNYWFSLFCFDWVKILAALMKFLDTWEPRSYLSLFSVKRNKNTGTILTLHYEHRNDGLIKFLRWSDVKKLQQRSKIQDKKRGSKPSTNSKVTLIIDVSYYSTHNGCKIIQTSVAILYVNIPITTVSS